MLTLTQQRQPAPPPARLVLRCRGQVVRYVREDLAPWSREWLKQQNEQTKKEPSIYD